MSTVCLSWLPMAAALNCNNNFVAKLVNPIKIFRGTGLRRKIATQSPKIKMLTVQQGKARNEKSKK